MRGSKIIFFSIVIMMVFFQNLGTVQGAEIKGLAISGDTLDTLDTLRNTVSEQEKEDKNSISSLDHVDATVVMPDGKAYFFHDNKYSLYDIATSKKQQTVRLDRSSTFEKKIPVNLDAALIHPINKKAYFFKGNKYYRYDFFKKKVDGPGKNIGVDGWKGLSGKIDAAISHPTENAAYFFQEDSFHKYSFSQRKVVTLGKIAIDDWRGVPNDIEAAMMHSNGKAYFFKGDQYYRYDFNEKKVDRQATVGKTGWKGLAFARDTSRDNDVKLKVTLTRIHPHQTEDSDNIGDYEIFQFASYHINGNTKNTIQRDVNLLSREPLMLYEDRNGKTFKKSTGYALISSGEFIFEDGKRWILPNYRQGIQLHLNEGQTKTVNNSVTFNVSQAEANDKDAKLKILTFMSELDDCGTLGILDMGCDRMRISGEEQAKEIDIYEVLKYLKSPSSFGPNYFSAQGGYHKYSGDSDVMKFRDDSDGALEGKFVIHTRNNDEKHDFWIRLELVK